MASLAGTHINLPSVHCWHASRLTLLTHHIQISSWNLSSLWWVYYLYSEKNKYRPEYQVFTMILFKLLMKKPYMENLLTTFLMYMYWFFFTWKSFGPKKRCIYIELMCPCSGQKEIFKMFSNGSLLYVPWLSKPMSVC